MSNIKIPTKEEVKKLLLLMASSPLIRANTIGELLGLKLIDSLLPPIKGEPDWNYDGLKEFFAMYSISSSDTFSEALEKLQ